MYYIIPKETYNKNHLDEVTTLLQDYCNKYLHDKNLTLKLVSSNNGSLLYELDYTNFNLNPKCIGDIMLKFLDIILKDGKIYLAQYNGTLEFFEEGVPKNFIILQEELLFENMTLEEKKLKLNHYIQDINTNSKDVIIIDPYLFAKRSTPEYKELLTYLLKQLNFSKLIIITSNKNYDEAMFNEIKSELGEDISIYFSNDYHDRFWISDYKKGFTTGTSLNGIGNKKCRIDFLEDDEVSVLVSDVKKSFNLDFI